MNTIEIYRSKKLSTLEATYGSLAFNGILVAYTVELPWKDNIPGKSCIPEGKYELHPHDSLKHPLVVSFHNPLLNVYAEPVLVPAGVHGRTDCLIHSANFVSELEGCLAPGVDYMYNTTHQPVGVKESKICISRLQKLWGNREGLEAVISWV